MEYGYKKIDLFGRSFIQKIALKPPFDFDFPVEDRACFLYVLNGELRYQSHSDNFNIPSNYSLLLNCLHPGKRVQNADSNDGEVVIVTFHPDVLKKIYENDLPKILRPSHKVSNQSGSMVNNDFLIQKYVEGLLFYFENPVLVDEEILVLKLKEIILLLAQTQDAETMQVILSQLFSPTTYSFKQIIEANSIEQVGIEELAKKTNLSLSSFKREFAKMYNNTPAKYLKNKRLDKAAELLLVSDKPITEIAFDCGFNDLANFTKSFNDKFHVSPSKYRLDRIAK
ncbi:helix-turn-helix domain-containing protein [Rhizosphaericola mali]|uniref:Helix-turn-helix transcriptional regulator n=1 Tax=Rhizosphaericola mali TaxID=2545455 RepID=A0A5P2GB59_9BACT|nr:AraC family transcriptional regulator [Rhizosphaericola mali]QES88791.1 helix-turn-helix transcriptional regulator [Rhizosphaericola mali]